MTKKYATGFALAANANLTDQIQAVQSGVDKQETLQQVFDLFQAQTPWRVVYLNGDYTVQATDNNTLFIRRTSSATLTLQDASVYASNFVIGAKNDIPSTSDTLFIECDATDTINLESTIIGLGQNNSTFIIKDTASNWATIFSSGEGGTLFPPHNINANTYTLALKDAGFVLYFPEDANPKTLTLPANAVAPISNGQKFIVYNPGSAAVTISSADDINGATSIPAGMGALIFKLVYGAPNTWVVLLLPTNTPSFTSMTLSTPLGYASGGTNANSLASAQTNLEITGLQTIWVPASAMVPALTNPATLVQTETSTNKNQVRAFQFSDSSTNNVSFRVAMPKRWDGTDPGFRIYWSTPDTSGNVLWQLSAVIRNDGSAQDIAFGTATTVSDGAQASANAESITSAFATVTPAGTPADNSEIEFRLFRDPANVSDTLNAVANITGLVLFYNADAGNDDLI